MALSLTTVLAVSTILIVYVTAQEQCIPELLVPGRAEFETDRDTPFTTNPCPLSTDSDLIQAAVDHFFPTGAVIPQGCTVNVTNVDCNPREGTENEQGFRVRVRFDVKINCSSNPCLGADVENITAYNATQLLRMELARIKDLDFQRPRPRRTFMSDGMAFRAKGRVRINERKLCAVCGDTVVDDNVKQYKGPKQGKGKKEKSKGKKGRKGRKGRKGKKEKSEKSKSKGTKGSKSDADENIEDILCDCEDFCLTGMMTGM